MTREPTTREISTGICMFCKGQFPKAKMTQHLKSCKQRLLTYAAEPTTAAKTTKPRKTTNARFFHLLVEGRDHPQYWMHLEASTSVMLLALDSFLRDTWLECCGHLSAFKIGDVLYSSEAEDVDLDLDELNTSLHELTVEKKPAVAQEKPLEFGLAEDSSKHVDLFPPKLLSHPAPEEEPSDLLRMLSRELLAAEVERVVKERSMFVELEKVLKVGQKFSHEYDFGSTTELKLKVIAEREAEVLRGRKQSIQVLARNVSPKIPCKVCGEPATRIEMGYFYAKDGAYCSKCARKSGLYVSEMLPVVNSPRVGVCGYTG
jgi:hypothetical protein